MEKFQGEHKPRGSQYTFAAPRLARSSPHGFASRVLRVCGVVPMRCAELTPPCADASADSSRSVVARTFRFVLADGPRRPPPCLSRQPDLRDTRPSPTTNCRRWRSFLATGRSGRGF
jgi:hypothetical protein